MGKQVFLTSDLHFGHSKMYELPFRRDDGTPLRPFATAEEADQVMIRRWNEVVRPNDRVYILGDLMIGPKGFDVLPQLNGSKVLCLGNHENYNIKRYVPHFKDIRSCHVLADMLLTHVPVHPDSIGKCKGNWHGHLHYRSVLLPDGQVDPRYLCLCVEHTDYRPISLEDAIVRFRAQQPTD